MVTEPAPAPPLAYQSVGGVLCLDFVDSVDRSVGQPLVETLHGYADLCRWSAQAGSLPRAWLRRLERAGGARGAQAVVARARALREALNGVFLALAEARRPPAEDLALLNEELARALGALRLAPEGAGYGLAWPADEDALDAPLWPIARSAGELLASPARALVKRCASETCLWLFLDGTKNAHRRWCDMKVCGNRAKVRAHRRRAARKARAQRGG